MPTQGRVWLITGCSSGFGKEIATAALAAGDRVMATARRPEQLADLVQAGGDRVRTAALDVVDPDSIDAAVAATLTGFGRIDVVVNNAGHGSVGAVEELTMTELRAVLDVMFFGAVAVTKAVLPHLREQGSGTIVQMSSMGGQTSPAGFGAYCSAKYALEALSDALAGEVAPFGVRVVIVEPGSFRTGFAGGRLHNSARLATYHATVGQRRTTLAATDGNQPGDPVKAAAAILRAVDSDEPPLRLALGTDAVAAIRAELDSRRENLDSWAELSVTTDF